MLHTVNKSPFERNSLDTCLRFAKPGSAILLIEDGVYAAMKGTAVEGKIRQALEKHAIYALSADVKARGIEESRLIERVQVVDYGGFVDLAVEHDKVQAWL
ncbi:MAG: sulfurtransferase complex subunit TusB [Gammaproteobacteria bacterium]|nr:MAG: sulfurtransferase complex subunit TusB [Gammaproteobacteria bacterium]